MATTAAAPRIDSQPPSGLKTGIEAVLSGYAAARTTKFGKLNPMYQTFEALGESFGRLPGVAARRSLRVRASSGQGNWAEVPWIAFLDERETSTTQRGVYPVLLFRADMTAVYLTFNQGVTQPKKERGAAAGRGFVREQAAAIRPRVADLLSPAGYRLDDAIELTDESGLGRDYQESTIAWKRYERGRVPDDTELTADVDAALAAYDRYLEGRGEVRPPAPVPPVADDADPLRALIADIGARGFVFEPWQVAAYVTAARTKPFVILAGVSGTGKSRLPRLVAEATGADFLLVPVRPDWTDSADVLGYTDLQGRFVPGAVLEFARKAQETPGRHHVLVVDEMNIARVEQYFAEVLSHIEGRAEAVDGGYASEPLVRRALAPADAAWGAIRLPPNLTIVGTVNMDESTHGFSRKVLDRAFTLEMSELDLTSWEAPPRHSGPNVAPWRADRWWPRALQPASLVDLTSSERLEVQRTIEALQVLNTSLAAAQLQVGYRVRDEIALFLIHALPARSAFVTRAGRPVDPLDLAVQMKVLPRVAGGSAAIGQVLAGLAGWAHGNLDTLDDSNLKEWTDHWRRAGRASHLDDAVHPRTAARVCLMWDRLETEGYTSYWL